MNTQSTNQRKFLAGLREHGKWAFGVLTSTWLVLAFLCRLIPNSKLALLFSVAGSIVAGLIVNWIFTRKEWETCEWDNPIDHFLISWLIFEVLFILTLHTANQFMQMVCGAFQISGSEDLVAKWVWKTSLLFLTFILICLFRREDQQQYRIYGIAYLAAIALEWTEGQILPLEFLFSEFILNNFMRPMKEAMLLFIIFDVAWKKKEANGCQTS